LLHESGERAMRLRMRVFPNLFIHKWSPQGKWWLLIVAAR